jgi:peptide deformylase
MAILNIVQYGDPILRKKCQPVTDFSRLQNIVDDMFDTMYEAEGIGLAANQVGLDLNLFIIDVTHTEEAQEPLVFVNGEIEDGWGESVFEEGCLSIPEVRLEVKRPEFIRFRYQTLDGTETTQEFGGLLARVIQHEVDHLNGVFIVDRVSPLVKMQYNKQLKMLAENAKQSKRERKPQKQFVL